MHSRSDNHEDVVDEKRVSEMIRVNKNPYQRGKYGNAKTGRYKVLHREKFQG